jgi:hypothetical protein
VKGLVTGRAGKVLGRLPQHLEAQTSGKLLGSVVTALVRDQDVQAADLQAIRRAHRVLEAPELRDLLLHAGLHNLVRSEMAVLFARLASAQAAYAALFDNVALDGDLAERETLAQQALQHWVLPDALPLRLFAQGPDEQPIDVAAAVDALLPSLQRALRRSELLQLVRSRIVSTARIHQRGNATVRAMLTGMANALDLDIGTIVHSDDRYWHAASAFDRWRLNAAGGEAQLAPEAEYLGLEENPREPAQRGPQPRQHAERFHIIRKGFDDALLETRVTGIGKRTVSPMLVNRDAGHGVGIFAAVPDGAELVFTQGGRALLDGADVTARAYAWRGACFADESARPFVFAAAGQAAQTNEADQRSGRFVEVSPPGTLDRSARLPHAGDSLPMPSIGIGKTHFAFFVQHGHFAALRPTATPAVPVPPADPFASTPAAERARVKLVTQRRHGGFADAAVFAGGTVHPSGISSGDGAAAHVALHWLERQAYCVRALIPPRFRALDDADGVLVAEQVRHALQRFRPAGVHVRVEYAESRWTLGAADLPVADSDTADPLSQVQSLTELWASPSGDAPA